MATILLAMAAKGKTRNHYSAHNFTSRLSFGTQASVNDSDHIRVVRIGSFVRAVLATKVEVSARAMAADGTTKDLVLIHISSTKVSFSIKIVCLGHCMIAIMTV